MSLFWLFRHKKAKQFDSWDKNITPRIELQTLNTRRHLDDRPYMLPKDDEEDNRLNLQHHALYHAIGNHYLAPIHSQLHTILDVGTGTGIWADEMARFFPSAIVVGLDVALSSFKTSPAENCFLCQGDVLAGLPFPNDFFSYTHQRLLVAAIPGTKWPGVIRELVRVTRPGGWIELVEIDNQMQNIGPATKKVQVLTQEMSASLGFDWERIRHLGDMLGQEGLEEVEMQPIPIPVGNWAGRIGQLMKIDLVAATNALRGRYCTQANITGAAFDQMIHAMTEEWEECHPSCLFYAAFGRKRTHP